MSATEQRREIAPLSNGVSEEPTSNASLERVAVIDEFKALLAAKLKFIVSATVFFLVYYFALPILVGYAPHLTHGGFMPLNSSTVGATADPITHDVDARWLMAYAAGLGDTLPCYLDTLRPQSVVGHPLFPVCVEWPTVLAMRAQAESAGLSTDEAVRSVHATHDVIIHRNVRPGDRLTTRATIVGVERRKPGAFQVMRLDTVDASGSPVCTTWQGAYFARLLLPDQIVRRRRSHHCRTLLRPVRQYEQRYTFPSLR